MSSVEVSRAEAEDLYRRGDLNGALRACLALLKGRPRDHELLNDAGAICFALGRVEESQRFFEQSLLVGGPAGEALGNLKALLSARGSAPGRTVCCPVCGGHFPHFLPFGARPRANASCPACNVKERHRHMWLLLHRHTDLFEGRPLKVLHMAPSAQIGKRFKKVAHLEYHTGDLDPARADEVIDITDIPYPEGTFDVVICSHVLEHVPEDRRAMAELHRVMAPGGWGLIVVPIMAEKTWEAGPLTGPEERLRLLGHREHVRAYGWDFTDRLAEAGFAVEVWTPHAHLVPDELAYYGLEQYNAPMHLVRKPGACPEPHAGPTEAGDERRAFRVALAVSLKGAGPQARDLIRERFAHVALKLCVVMDTGIGNMVMLTPLLQALRGLFPCAEIEVVGRRPALEVVEGGPYANVCTEVEAWDPKQDRDALLLTIWSNRLCKLHADAAGRLPYPVACVANPFAHNASMERFVAGAGWPALQAGGAPQHEADFHLALARALGFRGRPQVPCCRMEAAPFPFDEARPVALLADTADPTRAPRTKHWPHFRELADRLLAEGWQVGLVGGPAEAEEFSAADWPDGVVSLLGRYTIPQTAYLIKRAGLLIANDSGPAHVGAAVGATVHVLFGPTSDAKNRPVGVRANVITAALPCRPCQHTERWETCTTGLCMSEITVEHVMQQVRAEADTRLASGPDAYDPARYWSERLGGFGFSLRGVGNKRLTDAQNELDYRAAAVVLLGLCRDAGVDFAGASVLDVGCGTGFYAEALRRMGVRSYLGVDITDVLFGPLRTKLPGFEFRRLDASREELDGLFDLVVMIDVTQHITAEDGFSFAMGNVRRHLAPGGVFVVTSWLDARARGSFYEVSRPMAAYLREFPGWQFSTPLPFRDKFIFTIRGAR